MVELVGRQRERQSLETILDSGMAELVAVYGRRRIGKYLPYPRVF